MKSNRVECDQSVNGILLLNKPQGLSSNAVLQQVKRLYRAKKAGHTGSLDPLATGMLPICFGEATKFSQYLLDADKIYEASALLGIKTNTGDALGEIIEQNVDFNVSEAELLAVMAGYIGTIQQTPSMFSALKHKGVPLYKYARKGITLQRPAREVNIFKLELKHFDGKQFDIMVSCSKGTYIRNLVEDIGNSLGIGAHVTRLHRLYTAGFDDERMFSLNELEHKPSHELLHYLLPTDRAVRHLSAITLTDSEVIVLRQGRVLQSREHYSVEGYLRLYDETGNFIGLGEVLPSKTLIVKRLLTDPASKD
ncbi:tRNA pseudouridine(55) synthase TruB [Legionella lansingensis]|uniref:tRNA pseudouridine synthase B n=2 Tax=Legionella lansingensis TaxID=45067 RepID=A0A0W0VR94_9GAMM|nr:tRNA pseudouridine(55) synthase TruB [Legionella lansingensis]KTD22692.1 tRNA pseudouridine synthase B [Legionella lansingensis]